MQVRCTVSGCLWHDLNRSKQDITTREVKFLLNNQPEITFDVRPAQQTCTVTVSAVVNTSFVFLGGLEFLGVVM
jgi:hypothetical protein